MFVIKGKFPCGKSYKVLGVGSKSRNFENYGNVNEQLTRLSILSKKHGFQTQ